MILRSLWLAFLTKLVSSQSDCGLYLAETIDHEGGRTLGVFAGRSMAPGDLVGSPDVVVPLIDLLDTTSNILWDATDLGGSGEGYHVKTASLGLGSLTRGDPLNGNVMVFQSKYDDSGLHRSRDPGAGAISYYHEAAIVSTQEIEAGEELKFQHDYDHNQRWFGDAESRRENDPSATTQDPKVHQFFAQFDSLGSSNDVKSQLFAALRQTADSLDSSIRRLLPGQFDHMSLMSTHVLQQGRRTPQWLNTNGMCIDNIIQGNSHIEQAGRGAFASRRLRVGSVIAPAPVVLIDRESLEIEDEQPQLLMNYCFSHQQSLKLACPVGPGTALINHSPTPNAMIRWKNSTAKILEYVALRNIEEHEEITVHYGSAWQDAWDAHVFRWQPDDKDYVSAEDMNSAELYTIRTHEEQLIEPYPASVMTSCYYEWTEDGEESDDTKQQFGYEGEYKIKKYQQRSQDQSSTVPAYLFLRPCRILERHEYLSYNDDYVVEMMNDDHLTDSQQIPFPLIVKRVPRQAITFQDVSYSTDMHLPWAFRHPMVMDDMMFPNEWKDLD